MSRGGRDKTGWNEEEGKMRFKASGRDVAGREKYNGSTCRSLSGCNSKPTLDKFWRGSEKRAKAVDWRAGQSIVIKTRRGHAEFHVVVCCGWPASEQSFLSKQNEAACVFLCRTQQQIAHDGSCRRLTPSCLPGTKFVNGGDDKPSNCKRTGRP